MRNLIVALVIGLVIGGAVGVFFSADAPAVGGSGVVDRFTSFNFSDGLHGDKFSQGGGALSIATTSASYTLTQAELEDNNIIVFAAALAPAQTYTLPATSTLTTLLPDAGDYRTWVFENGHTAAATTTTIAAGTGIDLQEPDGQNVVIGINNYAFLTCFREPSTNVVCRVDETIPAD